MSIYKLLSAPIGGLLLGALCAGGAQAQQPQASLLPPYASYAAKFVCGQGDDKDVVVGNYLTAINIHNPQSRVSLRFLKKFVLAKVQGQTPRGCIVQTFDTLGPDRALYVDCATIVAKMQGSTACLPLPPLIEGFVVLQVQPPAGQTTPLPLDVVGKYTARPPGSAVSAMDIVVYHPTAITQ